MNYPCQASFLMNNWILSYGITNSIFFDNFPQFIANFWNTLCRILGIEHKTTTAYHWKTNGQAEWYIKTIVLQLRNYVSEHYDSWD